MIVKDGKYGFMNEGGKETVPSIYDKVGRFGEYAKEWILVESQGLKGFVDKDGNFAVPIQYTEVSKFDGVRKKLVKR